MDAPPPKPSQQFSDGRRLKFLPTAATFRLQEPLGVGTMGTVYRAESDDIANPVAVKILHPSIAHDAAMVDRFQREIVIMERLKHPHIVRHYGGGMMDGQYFYAMELLSHGSLRDRLQSKGPLPWPLAALYISQVAAALQHAHNHGIIHRDLKPTNLFFGDDGRLILGDFGIARDTREEGGTDPGRAVGTFAYMSPEQICADQEITGKSDLYSLGCVAYEMLAGRPPFSGANFAQVWDQHLHAQPRSLREQGVDCPAWLDELVQRLLAKEPDKRPFNARAVQGLIRDRLEDEFGADYANVIRDLSNSS
ncbi:MAG TPA: serine/threonine-protein kinase [Lacipirellula sp.]